MPFVGGSLGGKVYAVKEPRPGCRIDSPQGERYFYDPMSERFLCRWPPYSHRPPAP